MRELHNSEMEMVSGGFLRGLYKAAKAWVKNNQLKTSAAVGVAGGAGVEVATGGGSGGSGDGGG